MKIEFDNSYPYDTDVVMEWWIGSDDFYRDIGVVFGEQIDQYLNNPEEMKDNIRQAVALFLDWYTDTCEGSAFAAYHEYQLGLYEERLFER